MTQMASLAHCLARADWPAAEAILRKAAKAPDADAATLYNLARVLDITGQTAEARTWLERAVAKDPAHADAWFELGRSLIADDLEAAERAFAHSARLRPAADCWRYLARLRLRLCDWAGCAEALLHLPKDAETLTMSYRVASETGADTKTLRAQMLDDASTRPDALKALTRVARGSLPLRMPQARNRLR